MHPRSPIPTRSKTKTRMAASTPKFALTPGRANTNVLDLASKLGISAFHSGSAPLTVPFDGNSKDISMLQSQINRRATNSGWNYLTGDILTIKNIKNEDKDLITEYGCLSEEEIKTSLTYINTESRQAQNNQMMVECLLASLTEACFYKISNEESKYMMNKVPSAALLYKLLMQKAIIDTRATTYKFRTSLNNLSTYMGTVNSNIELFNHHVKNAEEGLSARGETVNDLCMKLFQGYKACADTNFVDYINKKEDSYLEGVEIDAAYLMQLALNKYVLRKENGEWGAPSSEQEQLTALTAELTRYKADAKKGSGKNKGGPKPGNKDKKDKKKKKTANNDEKWAWKKTPPANNQPSVKVFNDKTYYWCINHQAWTIHKPADCNLHSSTPNNDVSKTKKKKSATSTLNDALQAVIEEVDSDEE